MTLRIAINGFGRIGRNVLRALYTQGYRQDLQVVAINDLGDSSINAHLLKYLLKYDTVHGTFDASVEHDHESLTVNGDRIAVSAIRNPAELPWAAEKIDVVFECTGLFTDRAKAAAHISAGARKVIISAPAKGADAMPPWSTGSITTFCASRTRSSPTPRAPPTAWLRWPRCCIANWASKAV